MSDIDLTEAVEAAACGFCTELVPPVTLDDLSAIQRHVIREQALAYVTHAVPLIEAAVRAQVARELLAEAERRRANAEATAAARGGLRDPHQDSIRAGFTFAARFVRGGAV